MTTRISSLTVILDHDIREDDVRSLVDAIRMLVHVADVISTPADSIGEMVALTRYRDKVIPKIIDVLLGKDQ